MALSVRCLLLSLYGKVSAVALQVSRRKVSAVILVNKVSAVVLNGKVSAVSLTSPSWTERAVL